MGGGGSSNWRRGGKAEKDEGSWPELTGADKSLPRVDPERNRGSGSIPVLTPGLRSYEASALVWYPHHVPARPNLCAHMS